MWTQNVGLDLNLNCLTIKKYFEKKSKRKSQQTTTKSWKNTQHANTRCRVQLAGFAPSIFQRLRTSIFVVAAADSDCHRTVITDKPWTSGPLRTDYPIQHAHVIKTITISVSHPIRKPSLCRMRTSDLYVVINFCLWLGPRVRACDSILSDVFFWSDLDQNCLIL